MVKKLQILGGGNDQVSTFRRLLPQILASTAKNFILLDLGLAVAFPTIAIPALTGNNVANNPHETLHITEDQASWIGSIAFIMQPIGSVLSGWIAEPYGRKKALFIINFPHIVAWIMLYFSTTLTEVYVASILLGLGTGLSEAPIITYIGEICEPSVRGLLIACSGISAAGGFFMIFLLGSVMAWRTAAIICLSIPLATLLAICFIPETPLWLMSKNRPNDAIKSLQWLRGWVSPQAVEHEFQDLKRYNEQSNACTECSKKRIGCTHPPPSMNEKVKDLFRKRTMKPFFLVLFIFIFTQLSGLPPMRPYLVLILKAYGVPVEPNWATSVLGLMGILSNIVMVCVIRILGKRRLFMISITGTFSCCFALSIYGYLHLPHGWRSVGDNLDLSIVGTSNYFPFYVFIALSFFTNLGIWSIPWIMLSEVFPQKSREYAAGIAASANCIVIFISAKTYFDFERAFSLPGVALFYGIIGFAGFVSAYFLLPETENRTLEEIELHFSDNSRKITDIKIRKIDKTAQNQAANGGAKNYMNGNEA